MVTAGRPEDSRIRRVSRLGQPFRLLANEGKKRDGYQITLGLSGHDADVGVSSLWAETQQSAWRRHSPTHGEHAGP